MTEQLLHHIQQLVPGFNTTAEQLAPFFETRTVQKETRLLQENEPCNTLYFVNTGALYIYYQHHNQQQVIHFALENWWLTDYKTFADGKPAAFAIAAMENSTVTCLSRENYEALQLQFPLLALYFNKIHERAYGAALQKQKTFATVPKDEFYRYFCDTYPQLIRRIPAAIFASYIGVSPETLQLFQAQQDS
jgi:signal-transduction protein with cAMP-binding, CBS, and nucleotidyltransferase domain